MRHECVPSNRGTRPRGTVLACPTAPRNPLIDPRPSRGERPDRSLSEILEELACSRTPSRVRRRRCGAPSRSSAGALARLFEMIRTDRREQHGRIAQLERELEAAREQLAALGRRAARAAGAQRLRSASRGRRTPSASAPNSSCATPPCLVRRPPRSPRRSAVAAPLPPAAEPEDARASGRPRSRRRRPAWRRSSTPACLRVLPERPTHRSTPISTSSPSCRSPRREQAIAVPVRETPNKTAVDETVSRARRRRRPNAGAETSEAAGAAPSGSARAGGADVGGRPEPIPIGPRAARKRRLGARRRRFDARKLTESSPRRRSARWSARFRSCGRPAAPSTWSSRSPTVAPCALLVDRRAPLRR